MVDLSGAGTGHRVACHWTEQIESGEIQPHTVEATVDETGAALASDAEAQRLTEDIPFA